MDAIWQRSDANNLNSELYETAEAVEILPYKHSRELVERDPNRHRKEVSSIWPMVAVGTGESLQGG